MNLTEIDVAVTLVDLDEWSGDERLLDQGETTRASRHLRLEDRRRFTAAHSALRTTLGLFTNRSPESLAFSMNRYGKPRLAGPGPSFNISHSGNWAVIAVAATGDLGVDIETHDRSVDIGRLANRCFSVDELKAFAQLGGGFDVFFDLWTLKEAVVKADGRGLSVEPSTFTVDLGESPRLVDPPDGSDPTRWRLQRLEMPDGYRGALAVRQPRPEP